MDDDTRGDRPVPQLDFDLIEAVTGLTRQGHDRRNLAEAMIRWGTAFRRVEEGPYEAAQQLGALRDDCMREHRANGRAEEARRRRGTDHG